jgi:hypothetical protein
MTVIDERGRVFGRINLIDAGAALLLFVLIPVAYSAYLLFRTPPPKLTSIAPNKVYWGPNQRVQIQGLNLRPFMRVSFGANQGVTFSINSTTSAQVEVPELPPGVYDVVLYDYRQEVDRLPKALTILSLSPVSFIEMEVSGSFKNLNGTSARQFQAGQKLITGDISAEVLRLGAPVPSVVRVVVGSSTLSMPVPGQVEVPAALRVRCYTEVASDASVRCLVPGPQHPAPVAPDSMLTLPGPEGWVLFQIASAALNAPPSTVEVRVSFTASPDVAGMVNDGDADANAVGYASAMRATIVAINSTQAARSAGVIDATLRVPAVLGPSGWVYNNQPLKAGLPFQFETVTYVIRGQVTSMKTPAPVRSR